MNKLFPIVLALMCFGFAEEDYRYLYVFYNKKLDRLESVKSIVEPAEFIESEKVSFYLPADVHYQYPDDRNTLKFIIEIDEFNKVFDNVKLENETKEIPGFYIRGDIERYEIFILKPDGEMIGILGGKKNRYLPQIQFLNEGSSFIWYINDENKFCGSSKYSENFKCTDYFFDGYTLTFKDSPEIMKKIKLNE